MSHYHQVPTVVDVGVMTDAVRWIQDKVWVDRLEATIEAHTLAAAQVRENCTIPGTSVRTAWLCRDKPSMKEALRAAGVPTAASAAADHGRGGAGVRRRGRLPAHPQAAHRGRRAGHHPRRRPRRSSSEALGRFGGQGVESIAVEEFVEGHEGFYDTVSVDGHVAARLRLALLPERARGDADPLDLAAVHLDEPGRLGGRLRGAARAGRPGQRGARASAPAPPTWSGSSGRRACGSPRSAAGRPASGAWDLYSAGNDLDLYREWANAIVHGHVATRPSRRFATGIVALRPDRDGQITGYSGVDEVQARLGEWVIDAHLPPPGTPTQPVEAGYMANAYVRMRHPDYDVLRGMLDDVGRTVHVHAA